MVYYHSQIIRKLFFFFFLYNIISFILFQYRFDFRGVIDYIFCSRRLFSVLGVLGPLDTSWFSKHRIPGCPHHYIPSDHFPIVAELELLTKKSLAELEKQKQQQQQEKNLDNKSGNNNNNNNNNSGNNSNGHIRR